MTMMITRLITTIKLQRRVRACIYAVLLCAFFGAVADTRAQSKNAVCSALDMSTEDCSQIQSVSFDPPSFPWRVTVDTSVAGGSSLRSADIGDSQQSCIVLEVSRPANSMISVAGRTSSEGGFDQLQINADNLRIDTISPPVFQSERDWRQQSYFLPTSISTLRWCYAKDGSNDRGQDAAWIDNLSFNTSNISYQSRICAALDLTTGDCSLIQSVTFDPPELLWIITSETSVVGRTSLRSGDVDDNEQSCIVLEVSLPVNSVISGAARTSSEGGRDQLQISADNLRFDTMSAPSNRTERGWRQQSYFLPTTISTLSWCYAKNDSMDRGQDAAWVDNLSFETPDSYRSRVCDALDLTDQNCAQIDSISYEPPQRLWVITPETSIAGGSSLRSAAIGDDQQSCIVLEVSLPANSVVSVAGRTSSDGGRDQLLINADKLRLETISASNFQTERDWRQQSYFLPAAISTLSWCYTKDNLGERGEDVAWIDSLSFNTSNISYQSRICEALDMTDSDCSSIRSVSYDPPDLLWLITSETSIAGGSSLRSVDAGYNQQSCLALELSLPANSVTSVAARIYRYSSDDQIQIDADNLLLDTISAPGRQIERDWRQQSYFLPTAISTLSLCSNVRSAWIDNLSFDTLDSYRNRVCAALDLTTGDCSLIQSVSYEPPQRLWTITVDTFVSGGSSMRSGDIGDSGASCLVMELSLPANSVISVASRISSLVGRLQIDADNLRLNTRFDRTERDWGQQSYFLPTAISTLSWCYAKNNFGDGAKDTAWIDNLSFDTLDSYRSRLCAALDLTTGDCSLIQSVSYEPPQRLWTITMDTFVSGGSSLRSANVGRNQQSCLVLELSLPVNSVISVAGRTSSEGSGDQLYIITDNPHLDTISAPRFQTERDWRQQSYFLPTAISALRWCYAKNASDDAGQDAAWIDNLSFSASNISYQSRICDALDLTAGNCSLIQSIRYDPPELLWIITSQTSLVGRTSMRSGGIDRNESSCLVLELSLPANSVISVAGRTSSEGGGDQLYIVTDNLFLDTISAPDFQIERDWRQQSYFLPTTISALGLCYTKNGSDDRGQDAAWIDSLSFSTSAIPYQSRVCDALDLTAGDCSLIQSVSYEPPQRLWVITSETSIAGGSSLRSAYIDHNQTSCLVLEVSLPANSVISVAGRASARTGYDQLQIDADNLRLDTISVPRARIERDWRQQSYFLPTAISTLSWCYAKTGFDNRGQDAVWIDNLSFSASNIPYQRRICEALDLTDQNCTQIDSISYEPPQRPWLITPETSIAGGSSLRSADIGGRQQSCLVLELSLPANSVISVAGRTSSEGGDDQLQVIADNLRIDTISTAEDQTASHWRQESYFLPAAISTLSWCYAKVGLGDSGQDAAWIDNLSFSTSNIPYQSRVCDALDLTAGDCSLIQSVSYDPPASLWFITMDTFVSGGSSLRSYDIDRSQQSCLVLEVSLPANSVISIAGRISSQPVFDQLLIDADKLRVDTIFAPFPETERDWRQQSYFLPTAISTLSWCYVKNRQLFFPLLSAETAWIDNLSFDTLDSYQSRICDVLDLTAGDCSLIQSVSYEPPQRLWAITSETSIAGGSSLRSADIDDDQQSCLVLEVSLPANSVISVAGRTSSEGGRDQLQFNAGALRIDTLSAPVEQTERDWRQQSYFLPTAISTLSWCYAKGFSDNEGQDAAWIDNLRFSASNIPYQNRICEALDLTAGDCSLIQSVSYDPPQRLWAITSETSIAGGSSLRSGGIESNRQSCLVLEVSLPANSVISIAGRTSSQGGFDQLQVIADKLRLNTISAPVFQTERDWRQQSYFLPAAISELRWCYTKDRSLNSGLDRAWIDNLSFSASNISYQSRICEALDLTSGDCSLIQSITYNPPELLWVITSETSIARGSSLRSADIGDRRQSCLVLEVSLPANSVISVAARTSSEGGEDQLQVDADKLRFDTISALFRQTERGWRLESYFLPTAISTLSWCYTKDSSRDRGQDAAWIDNLSFDTLDSYQSRVCDALDLTAGDCSLIQSVSYEPPQLPWALTPETSVAGGSSLRSGDIGRNQQSCIVLEVSLPANSVISVAGRTSSEGGEDQLQVIADKLRLDTLSAPVDQTERDWRLESYFLPAAISTLRWCYDKRTIGSGEDAVWIDSLSFSTSNISYQSRVCEALDLTAGNCSLIQSISYEPPQRLWVITMDTFVTGGSSLRSGDIDYDPFGHNQQSCLMLEVSLPANSVISVAGRTSSEGHFNQLQIDADNLRLDTLSAPSGQIERNWRQQSYFLPTAISTLSWCYDMRTRARGEDAVWIDNLSFYTLDSYRSRVCEALDLTAGDCSLIQSVSYEPPQPLWVLTSETSVAGGSSLQSGDIGRTKQSCLVLELSLPANSVISVAGRTSSEGGVAQLRVDADSLRLDTISAPENQIERGWRQQNYLLPTAISALSWCYAKGFSDNEGQDAAWIDNLSFGTLDLYRSRVCAALDLTAGDCSRIQSISYEPSQPLWVITSETSIAGGSSLRSGGSLGRYRQSCLILELSLPANSVISVAVRTSSEGGEDQLRVDADKLRLDTISAPENQIERGWKQQSYLLPTAMSALSWCYYKRGDGSFGEDAAWIDNLSFGTLDSYRSRVCDALDMTAGDCSLVQSISYEPPQRLWVITSETSIAGGTSLRSGNIGFNQTSCLVLELSLPANSVISIAARTSSEGGRDQLQIDADNLHLDTISAPNFQIERGWKQQSYLLPTAMSALSWCYAKDGSRDRGQDAAWIDNLSFGTLDSYRSRVCAALDMTTGDCSLIQSISYEPPQRLWMISSETSIAGGSSLRSGNIGRNQQSCLVLELSLPANSVISVAARTSSRGGVDQLQIDADKLRLDTISAPDFQTERDWKQQSYFLPAAISTLSWCYAKDGSQDRGQDAAWIDNLSFDTLDSYRSRVCDALDLTTGDCSLIQSVSYEPPRRPWVITMDTFVSGDSSLRSGDIGASQQSCLVLELSLPANSVISVAGRTSSEGGFDQLRIDAGNLRLNTISAPFGQTERDWRLESYLLPAAISALSWCYAKNGSDDAGQDATWIDSLSFSTSDIPYQRHICEALDLTDNRCSLIQSIRYDPPASLWIITSQTSVVGMTSMRSGDIGRNQQSCLVLELSLPANSVISVAGRTSSEGGSDQLQIFADDLRIDTISAKANQTERNWRQQRYFLPTAISTLRWCYTKDNSRDRGQDAAWIDNLSFSASDISYQSRICAALDMKDSDCSSIRSITYEPPQRLWVITSETSVVGGLFPAQW